MQTHPRVGNTFYYTLPSLFAGVNGDEGGKNLDNYPGEMRKQGERKGKNCETRGRVIATIWRQLGKIIIARNTLTGGIFVKRDHSVEKSETFKKRQRNTTVECVRW